MINLGRGKTNKLFCFDTPSSVQRIPKLVNGSNFVDPFTKVDVFAVTKIHIALVVVVKPFTLFGIDVSGVPTAPIFMDLRRHENLKSDRCVCNLCGELTHVDFITHSYNTFKKITSVFHFSAFFKVTFCFMAFRL
jgi:hypothetical protein